VLVSNCGRKYDMILLVSESLQALVLLIASSIHVAEAMDVHEDAVSRLKRYENL